MPQEPTEPVKSDTPQLDYFFPMPRRKTSSRVAYGIIAGVFWLAGSYPLIFAIILFIEEVNSSPYKSLPGPIILLLLLSVLLIAVVWHFTRKAA
jgi:hypothetical protein